MTHKKKPSFGITPAIHSSRSKVKAREQTRSKMFRQAAKHIQERKKENKIKGGGGVNLHVHIWPQFSTCMRSSKQKIIIMNTSSLNKGSP